MSNNPINKLLKHTLMALLRFICFMAIACAKIRAHEEVEAYQDIEFDRRLKLLNKLAIKTIELSHGVFDCVDIYKQPAFDNPLLRNHKIQMKPTHIPIRSDKIGHSTGQSSDFGSHIDCPKGTVPIRRTTKNDLIRENSIGHVRAYHPTTSGNPNMHFAALEVHHEDDKYKVIGAKSAVGIFKPQVNKGESSGAQIWLSGTSDGNNDDGISAGWMVDPALYGDSEPHFTASWMGKGGAGCFNLLCAGYVQVDSQDPIGFILPNISRPGGPLFGIDTSIFQDNVTKNWWLISGAEGKPMGYWPKELFSTFDDGAKLLSYGGIVKSVKDQLSPAMGSVYDDKCDFLRTAFFALAQYKITDELLRDIYLPVKKEYTKIRVDCPIHGVYYPCTGLKYLDFYFLYGGPRGNCGHA